MDLAPLTTLGLGGPAREVLRAGDEVALVAAVRDRDARGEPVLLLAGGSNVVVADAGVAAIVVQVATRGVEVVEQGDRVLVRAQAGEPWDPLVARCVAEGLAGLECLSGIPGSVGATPIQNVGAYGQEVADTIASVRVLDRQDGEVHELTPSACGFGYRTSTFKQHPGRHVVLAVTFALARGGEGAPVRYAELARALAVQPGEHAPLADVREAVLALRRGKGMVLDPADPDTRSVGSFFTNPVLDPAALARVGERAGARPPAFPQPDGTVKTSAAWLIEQAGFQRGHGDPATVAISDKHVLALTNRGAGTTAGLVELAREIADGVERRLGVRLEPEPVFVGHAWRPRA